MEGIHVDGRRVNEVQTAIAECTWDDVAGEYVVFARVTGRTEWRTFNLLDEAEQSPDCVIAAVQYGSTYGIDEERPLTIEVRDQCDEVDERYEGGCPAYT